MSIKQINKIQMMYGLSQLWYELKITSPFVSREKINLDEEYFNILNKIDKINNDIEYYLELMRFVSLVNDDHTAVYFPEYLLKEMGDFPIALTSYTNKIYIFAREKGSNITLGSEVIEINNIPINEYLDKFIFPYCWHYNKEKAIYNFNYLIPAVEYGKVIKIKTLDGEYELSAKQGNIEWEYLNKNLSFSEKLKMVYKPESKSFSLYETSDNIGIIFVKTCMNNSLGNDFYSNMTLLKKYRGFIIDVRGNSGGNSQNIEYITQAFINGPFKQPNTKYKVHIGAYKAIGNFCDLKKLNLCNPDEKKLYEVCNDIYFEEDNGEKNIKECPFIIDKPLVILQDRYSTSATESLLIEIDYAKRGVLVGENSHGSTGTPLMINLPGGGMARVCTAWVTYPDGKEFLNTGVQPHIYISPTIDDIKNGEDVIMKKGLEELRKLIY